MKLQLWNIKRRWIWNMRLWRQRIMWAIELRKHTMCTVACWPLTPQAYCSLTTLQGDKPTAPILYTTSLLLPYKTSLLLPYTTSLLLPYKTSLLLSYTTSLLLTYKRSLLLPYTTCLLLPYKTSHKPPAPI